MTDLPAGDGQRLGRLLVVEPNPKALALIERYLLLSAALSVRVAPSPLAALMILQDRRRSTDCVICAHAMAPMTGLEFLRQLRAGRYGNGPSIRDIRFVLTLKRNDQRLRDEARSAGAQGVIEFPCDRDVLAAAVAAALIAPSGPGAAIVDDSSHFDHDWTQRFAREGDAETLGFIDHVEGTSGRVPAKYVARLALESAEFSTRAEAERWLKKRSREDSNKPRTR
jgi:CheY-like chemotaxis protein